ncbi:NUDIX domain-containing protein [Paenibacillus oenotherae]|uniref:NUDIX domain-containing protein n=1 Tax=Paenibacillus oenotherae TaxID=1435645 RepID=A0ABS7D7U2_9BACL|nr:NUDIX domain-containing protein [Paenibacillus oenotherae]MBW7476015.1 NUDIX domain-containing protein [Paenibacillus oenotherae]
MSINSNESREEERFDIYDKSGAHIGTAARSDVHAQGYWHRSFHCWLIRREGSRKLVLFQLRHGNKDTFPLHFDITAAGHLTAGETVQQAVREVEEELGIPAAYESLIPLGEIRLEARGMARGRPFIDREISDVFGLVYDDPIESLKLQADEVIGVYEAELDSMIALFEDHLETVTAQGFEVHEDGRRVYGERLVKAAEFVPRPFTCYADVFRSLRAHA